MNLKSVGSSINHFNVDVFHHYPDILNVIYSTSVIGLHYNEEEKRQIIFLFNKREIWKIKSKA